MNKTNRLLKRYFRNVKQGIPNSYPNKSKVIDSIKSNVYGYCAEQPDATMDDIIKNFGSSSEIICSFIDELDPATIAHTLKRRNLIILLCTFFSLFFVVILLFYIKYIHSTALDLHVNSTVYVYESTELPTELSTEY